MHATRRAAPMTASVIPLNQEDTTMSQENAPSSQLRILARAFAPIDRVAFGCATGAVFAAGLFFASAWLLMRGGAIVGPTLGLLGQYLPGFQVTWPGAFIGLAYGAVFGFVTGWATAHLKNMTTAQFIAKAKSAATRAEKRKFLDYV
ncbi:MAG: hypothetical protein ACKVU1_07070 [bacterium]